LGATLSVLASLISPPKGLILIGATPHFGRAWKAKYIENFLRALEENFENKVMQFRKQIAGRNICNGTKLERVRAIKLLKEFIERDFSESFKKLEVPTLVLHGKKDTVVPFREAKKLVKLNPLFFELVIYDGGHFPVEFTPRDWEKLFERFGEL